MGIKILCMDIYCNWDKNKRMVYKFWFMMQLFKNGMQSWKYD